MMARKSKTREQYVKLSGYLRKMARARQKEYGQWLGSAKEVLDKFKPISQMGEKITAKDLRRAIKQMQGVRKELYKKNIETKLAETIETMHNARGGGYEWINRQNILPFLNMMDALHGSALESIFGSGYVAVEVERALSEEKNPIPAEQLQANLESWIERAQNKQIPVNRKGRATRGLNLKQKFKPLRDSSNNDY